ncbi:40S ribosomal protein S2 [Astathelohania contejeani]|uniref:Small ribosomal subunit protein uS5 n=1 Tax=Astathelohania contejeani TaxID=164912 RepID=A0ABQ7HZW2_9MICR|nr:40S ribosomal protein S2 [Thelohania contejeani]
MQATKGRSSTKDESKPNTRQRSQAPEKEWIPCTKLGILVKEGKIGLEEIMKQSKKIKEPEIVDYLCGDTLQHKVIANNSVQKQTKAGQRTRMKAVVVVGTSNGYLGIGSKSAKEASKAIAGALARAKCKIKPIAMGHWSGSYSSTHTVPVKASGKVSSVSIRLIPAPKGTGLVAGEVPKIILKLAGIKDVYTHSVGRTSTKENFAYATVRALQNASNFFRPCEWKEPTPEKDIMIKHSRVISDYEKKMKL